MARTSRRRVVVDESDDDENVTGSNEQQEETHDDDNDNEGINNNNNNNNNMVFMSQAPEMSQDIRLPRTAEINNLHKLSNEAREKAIMDVARLVLFRACLGEPIDRTKCVKDAGISDARITSAIFVEVDARLRDCFGFELKRIPRWMEKIKALPKVKLEKYYIFNTVQDEQHHHHKIIHGVHKDVAASNAMLLMTLSFAYCQGARLGDGSRWILDKDLYRLMNRLDDNVPDHPPATEGSEPRRSTGSGNSSITPSLDALLDESVKQDYLLRIKNHRDLMTLREEADEDSWFYSMGPRSAVEIGHKQIILFCSDILGVDADPLMLQEHDEEEVEMQG